VKLDLSIVLCLRNVEPSVATMVRRAAALGRALADDPPLVDGPADATRDEQSALPSPGAFAYEILALDQSSTDNTLSVLSVLHGQFAELRTVQDLEPGSAVMRAARLARGRVWLLLDRVVDQELCHWGARQVFCGHRAAVVPGELLAVERGVGQASLGWLRGGLVAAQGAVERSLEAQGELPVRSPAPDRGLKERARLILRGRLSRLGLGAFDRPKTAQ
jgi:hypothetical protein